MTLMMFVSLIAFSAATGGIYRHDKPKSRYKVLAHQQQFDCVAQLFWNNTWQGSCVLVGDRYVLSAAHCFMDYLTRQETIDQDGKRVMINQPYAEYVKDITRYFITFKGKKYRSKTVHIYPEYLDKNGAHNCDIALIELEQPVTGITPAALCTTFNELGSAMAGVGYGAHGIADQPEHIIATPEKLAGENTIDSICGFTLNGRQVSMLCDFDHPTNNSCNSIGSSSALPLEYIASGGDSGGGAFRKTSTGWELIGICGGTKYGGVDIQKLTTKGIGYYGQTMEWQRVSVFAEWIKSIAQQRK